MIAVVDYEAGNIFSISHALRHLGASFEVTSDPVRLEAAEKIVLPGVGAARPAMRSLQNRGLVQVLRDFKGPFLGICLGLQLMFERSAEEDVECLGLLSGTVRRFALPAGFKVPHMGWNQLAIRLRGEEVPLLEGIESGAWFYFVHSYYAPLSSVTAATCNYSVEFAAVAGQGHAYGVQFHPELSGSAGLQLLTNFLELDIG